MAFTHLLSTLAGSSPSWNLGLIDWRVHASLSTRAVTAFNFSDLYKLPVTATKLLNRSACRIKEATLPFSSARPKSHSPTQSLTLTSSTHLSYVVRSTHLLTISSYILPNTDIKVDQSKVHYKSNVEVDGYDWEIRLYPVYAPTSRHQVELQLVFLGEAGANKVAAALSCRIVDPRGKLEPLAEKTGATASFQHPLDSSEPLVVITSSEAIFSPYKTDSNSLTVECTVTVFRDIAFPVPSSNLRQHLGELLASKAGSDVTFTVSGESFPAHKNVLAARSPVFMAEFFGELQDKSSGHVEINEMDASVFEAMLRFVYTDAVPELDGKLLEEAATTTLAQHLLVAADRYGLDRLRMLCERRLAFAMDVGNVAATLAVAEQHGCAQLKAKCVEFITGGSLENFHAVLKSDGFKDLEVNHPALLTELLVAAHGRMEGLMKQ